MSVRRNLSRAAARRSTQEEDKGPVQKIVLAPYTSQRLANLVQVRDEANQRINEMISVATAERGLDLDEHSLTAMEQADDGRFYIWLAKREGPKLEVPDPPAQEVEVLGGADPEPED